MQDYQQNRKTAGSNAFGQSAFGSTTRHFTASSFFGQPAQQQPSNPIFGSFGNTAANSTNTGTGNAFSGLGQNPAQPTGGFGTFNQTSQQPATNGFGAFGRPQPPPQPQPPLQPSAGLFGNAGAFGSQNKPSGGFGKLCAFACTYNLALFRGWRLWGRHQYRIYRFVRADQHRPAASCFH